jgi:hypothetical protein
MAKSFEWCQLQEPRLLYDINMHIAKIPAESEFVFNEKYSSW